jgi:hypothetical protein
LLSKISPEIVGEPMEVNRLYDAVNILMSWMVNMFKLFDCLSCKYFMIFSCKNILVNLPSCMSTKPWNCKMVNILKYYKVAPCSKNLWSNRVTLSASALCLRQAGNWCDICSY